MLLGPRAIIKEEEEGNRISKEDDAFEKSLE